MHRRTKVRNINQMNNPFQRNLERKVRIKINNNSKLQKKKNNRIKKMMNGNKEPRKLAKERRGKREEMLKIRSDNRIIRMHEMQRIRMMEVVKYWIKNQSIKQEEHRCRK